MQRASRWILAWAEMATDKDKAAKDKAAKDKARELRLAGGRAHRFIKGKLAERDKAKEDKDKDGK
jgi:hypothetical protein